MELKKREEQIQEAIKKAQDANEAKSIFLANMGHEIKTPLNSIIGFASLLKGTETSREQKKYISAIEAGSKTLNILIEDIMDFSKLERGVENTVYTCISIRTLIDELVTIFDPEIRKKELSLDLAIDDLLPDFLELDENKIRHIVLNVFGNAIKFCDEGGVGLSVITDKINKENNTVDFTIKIEDSGIGIAKEDKANIFKPFERALHPNHRHIKGAGLGLAIVKNYTEMIGGEISLFSQEEKGSVFYIRLKNIKICKADAKNIDENIDVVLKPFKMVLIDDEVQNQKVIEEMLRDQKAEIYFSENAGSGFEIMKLVNPDIIFLDYRIPGMSGGELAEKIKQDPQLKDIPLIAYSANLALVTNDKSSSLFSDCLAKPITREKLLQIMSKFLANEKKNSSELMIKKALDDKILRNLFLHQKVLNFWLTMEKSGSFRDMQAFVDEVKKEAKNYESPELEQFLDEFSGDIGSFDVLAIKNKQRRLRKAATDEKREQ